VNTFKSGLVHHIISAMRGFASSDPAPPRAANKAKAGKKTVVMALSFASLRPNAPLLVFGQTVFARKQNAKVIHNSNNSQEEQTQMKLNQWTLGLAAAGVISFGAVAQADEKPSHQVLTAVSSTALSGYVSTSAHWNPGTAAGAPGYSYGGAKNDGFNLNVVDITISKPLDEGEWAAGYTAELWMGPDAAGLGNVTGGSSLAIKQANVALNAPVGNGIVFKMGIFDCPVGYEAANATDNPNYTRSYGYTVEPTSLTGLLATYKVCESFSVTAVIANELAATVNGRASGVQSQKTYCLAGTVTAPDSWGFLKGAAVTAGAIDGISTGLANAGVAPDATLIYLGATIPTPWETLKVGASWDHVNLAGNTLTGKIGDTDSFALYTSFSGIEKLKINTRLEYYDNNTGIVALGGPGVVPGNGAASGNAKAEILAATLTLDYSLWANVITRLEYRWDHDLSAGRNLPGNANSGAVPATAGNNNAQLIALNVIYKF